MMVLCYYEHENLVQREAKFVSRKKKKRKFEWLEFLKAVVIAIILVIVVKSFVLSTSIVEGESMEPTLVDGERIVYNKLVYLIDSPDRGDVVIIKRPFKNYVKRIIALPGEKIEMKNHVLYIDDQPSEQEYLTDESDAHTGNFGPYLIPKEHYFVMGDNRAVSKDSRNGLGLIEEDEIIGRSEFIYFPFSEWSRTK